MGSNESKKYGTPTKNPARLSTKDFKFFTHQTGRFVCINSK